MKHEPNGITDKRPFIVYAAVSRKFASEKATITATKKHIKAAATAKIDRRNKL